MFLFPTSPNKDDRLTQVLVSVLLVRAVMLLCPLSQCFVGKSCHVFYALSLSVWVIRAVMCFMPPLPVFG